MSVPPVLPQDNPNDFHEQLLMQNYKQQMGLNTTDRLPDTITKHLKKASHTEIKQFIAKIKNRVALYRNVLNKDAQTEIDTFAIGAIAESSDEIFDNYIQGMVNTREAQRSAQWIRNIINDPQQGNFTQETIESLNRRYILHKAFAKVVVRFRYIAYIIAALTYIFIPKLRDCCCQTPLAIICGFARMAFVERAALALLTNKQYVFPHARKQILTNVVQQICFHCLSVAKTGNVRISLLASTIIGYTIAQIWTTETTALAIAMIWAVIRHLCLFYFLGAYTYLLLLESTASGIMKAMLLYPKKNDASSSEWIALFISGFACHWIDSTYTRTYGVFASFMQFFCYNISAYYSLSAQIGQEAEERAIAVAQQGV